MRWLPIHLFLVVLLVLPQMVMAADGYYTTEQIQNMVFDFATKTFRVAVTGGSFEVQVSEPLQVHDDTLAVLLGNGTQSSRTTPYSWDEQVKYVVQIGVDSGSNLGFTDTAETFLVINRGPGAITYALNGVADADMMPLPAGGSLSLDYTLKTFHAYGLDGTADVRLQGFGY